MRAFRVTYLDGTTVEVRPLPIDLLMAERAKGRQTWGKVEDGLRLIHQAVSREGSPPDFDTWMATVAAAEALEADDGPDPTLPSPSDGPSPG